ncbi:MAG: peptidylprolyl isomerase [Bacteroidaceae bacterium]|nr:peptidylprolyl isomerase [Bacteroidaceae bacterium]
MKRKTFLLFSFLCISLAHAQDDPIVMHVNGQPVTRSEFEYNYNKNNSEGVLDKKNVEEYAQLFVNYKLKVQAALDNHLDTLSSYQKEFRQYRDQQIRPLLIPQNAMEEECKKYYDQMLASLQGKELLQPSHIFLRVPQAATEDAQAAAKARIDSVAQELKNGADFAELAKKVSQDPGSAARGGLLPWIGPNQTLKEFEDVAYSLEVGQVSEPFLSTVGYHIIKLMDKKPLESYDELKENIRRYLESQGLENQLAAQVLDSMAQQSSPQKTVEEILDEETERLCAQDNELKYLVQEYHDGLLLFEECSRNVWEPASKDTTGIASYFKANKKKYAWKEPHFRGLVYYCKNEADVKAVKKCLKGVPEEKWTATIREQFNKDSVMVRMERRLFQKGDNANVDVLALKDKSAKLNPLKDFPYAAVAGKVLKKGPEKWTDISNQVVTDYQRMREDEYVAALRKRYPVEIHEDVLKTVNNH